MAVLNSVWTSPFLNLPADNNDIYTDIYIDVMHTFVLFVATAPQQEPEAELTADPPNKGLGQASSGPNSLRDTTVSAPSDKDTDTEKSADSVPVTLS